MDLGSPRIVRIGASGRFGVIVRAAMACSKCQVSNPRRKWKWSEAIQSAQVLQHVSREGSEGGLVPLIPAGSTAGSRVGSRAGSRAVSRAGSKAGSRAGSRSRFQTSFQRRFQEQVPEQVPGTSSRYRYTIKICGGQPRVNPILSVYCRRWAAIDHS